MVKVSIVMPMFNQEKYIVECLSSVLRQTLQEIEIIVVNDGSTDNSLASEGICTARRQDCRYRQAEQRLRAFHERRNG